MKRQYIPIIVFGIAALIAISYFIYDAQKTWNKQDDILKKFHELEENFERANKTLGSRKDSILQMIPPRNQAKAKNVSTTANAFHAYVESMKDDILKHNTKDDILSNEKDTSLSGAEDLHRKMLECARQMLQNIEDRSERNAISSKSEFTQMDLELLNQFLNHSPLAGIMAILTKIQNDCEYLEFEVLKALAK